MSDYPSAAADLHTRIGPAGSHFEIIDELSRDAPVYWNDEAQGYWVITRYEDIITVGRDTDTFTNESIVAVDPNPAYRILPSNAEPPLLRHLRAPVSAFLTAKRVERHREPLRSIANELIDGFADDGGVELMSTVAEHYPVRMFCQAMNQPESDAPFFLDCMRRISRVMFEGGDPAEFISAMSAIRNYFADLLVRREHPLDTDVDIVSHLLHSDIGGREITDEEFLDLCMTLTLGSLDTSKSVLGWFFWHMALNDDDRRLLVRDPSIIPSALEEILRAYTVFSAARKLSEDVEFRGCPMHKGDMALLHYTAASRDATKFADPEKVILDRKPNDHMAFGRTAHRCLGMHLARLELQIFIQEWHKRIPEYRLESPESIMAHGGQHTILSLPLAW